MPELQGRRYADNTRADKMEPGGYSFQDWTNPTHWQIRDPFGDIGSIRTHTIEIHEDATISVTPSIAPNPTTDHKFHGFLKRGVWTW